MHEREVIIQTDDGPMDCFITHPEEDGPHPAVIIYMDAPGIREELRDMARRLGTVGYYVMLHNMYYRVGTEGNYGFDLSRIREDQSQLQKMFDVMLSLSNAMVVADTGPLLAHLRSDPAAKDGPVGCIGYCMSGQFVGSVGAAYPDDFAAIASFYGVKWITDQPDSPHLKLDRIKGEMYLAFAEVDAHVPQEIVDALPGHMDAAGCNYRIESYPGTDHGFAFPQRPAYVKPAGERHWERIFSLMDRQLRS